MFHIKYFLFLRYLSNYDKKLYGTGYIGSIGDIDKLLKDKKIFKNRLFEFPNILLYLKESELLTYKFYNDEYVDFYEDIKLTNKGIHYIEFTLKIIFKYLFSNVAIPIIVAIITTLITLELKLP